jgi:HK97 family phage portal protein
VKVPGKLSDGAFERFQKSFKEKYSGVGNSSKVLFLEDGSEFVKTGTDPDKSQAMESRKFQIAEIARFFYNVPLHKILELDRATFNNIEQLNIAFVQDCLNPISIRIEQSIYKCLLTKKERKKYFAKFNTNALLRGDVKSRQEYYTAMIQNGVFSPNNVLELEDMNTYEGGDVHIFNAASIPVDKIHEGYKKGGTKNEQT